MDPFKTLNKIKGKQLDEVDFKADARRMRQSKKWKENRDEFLEDVEECQWCGRESDSFDVHHEWGKSFSRQWMKATDEAFVESDSYHKELTDDREECPECGKRDYYERKTMNPTYRCNNCKNEFSKPSLVDGGQAITEDDYDNKPYTTYEYYEKKAEWVESNRESVLNKFKSRYDELLEEYASLREDQVVAICSKCHYKEEKTKKKLCNECGENWYDPSYGDDNMCWDCIVELKGLEICSNCEDGWYNPSSYDFCKECRD